MTTSTYEPSKFLIKFVAVSGLLQLGGVILNIREKQYPEALASFSMAASAAVHTFGPEKLRDFALGAFCAAGLTGVGMAINNHIDNRNADKQPPVEIVEAPIYIEDINGWEPQTVSL